MKKWIVRFNDVEAIETLRGLEILSYVPTLYNELKFVFINTDMDEEDILKIEGITRASEARSGTLNV